MVSRFTPILLAAACILVIANTRAGAVAQTETATIEVYPTHIQTVPFPLPLPLSWDPAADCADMKDYWSPTLRNPNGEWLFGDAERVGGIVRRMEGPQTSSDGTWAGFQKFFMDCFIGLNTRTSTVYKSPADGGALAPPGQILFNAGKGRPGAAVLRWTSPCNARISITAAFTGNHVPVDDSDPGTVRKVRVSKNGVELWHASISGFAGSSGTPAYPPKGDGLRTYDGLVDVAQGDSLDFICDYSNTPAGHYAGLTGLRLRMVAEKILPSKQAVPPPGWIDALEPKGTPGPPLHLAYNGVARYSILLPWRPTTQDTKAALDLRRWLYQMTGAVFPLQSELASPSAGMPQRYISIGETRLLASAAIAGANKELGQDGYGIFQKNGNIFLIGGSRRGPIDAVYAVLEEDLGCRWYDRYSSTIPWKPDLKARIVSRTFVPKLDIRDPFYWYAFDQNWSLRNRTNAPWVPEPKQWGGTTTYAMFVHSLGWLMNPSDYFKDHPEYFALHDGKRTPDQPCLSNADALRIVIDNVKKTLRDSPESQLISISLNDNDQYCECPACAASDASENRSGTLMKFANAVADAIRQEFPTVKVSELAYAGTFEPPKTLRPRDNVVIQLCSDTHALRRSLLLVTETEEFHKALEGWAKIGAPIYIWDYTTNFSQYCLPMPNMQVCDFNFEYFLKKGARGIMTQGSYESPGGENAAMRSWVWAKKLWDPSLDSKALMRDFIFGYYREAAKPIWDYNMLLWNMWERNHRKPLNESNPLTCSSYFTPRTSYLSKQFIAQATALMAKAEKLAVSRETKRRVTLAKYPILNTILSREIGYVGGGRIFEPGDSLFKPEATRLRPLVDEFERITLTEGVTRLAEANNDVPNRIKRWRDLLDLDLGSTLVFDLSNEWKFRTDPQDAGVAQAWYAEGTDDSSWSTVRSDQDAGWEKQGFADYDGFGWYRQSFIPPASLASSKHVYMYFGAIDEQGWIFINGKPAFERTAKSTGMTPLDLWDRPFVFDAKPFLRFGEPNTLAVRVHDDKAQGGVWRPVQLIATSVDTNDINLFTVAIKRAGKAK